MANPEGTVSSHVTDATKILCPYCNSSRIQLTTVMDDPADIADPTFNALFISATGGSFQGLVALCHCGKEFTPYWWILDVGAATAVGNVLTMSDLDSNRAANATTNLLAGLYCIYLDAAGDDTGEYFVVATNNAAAGVELVLTVAPTDNDDGLWMITNILPLGITLHT